MRQKSVNQKPSSERIVKDIRRSVSCWTACGVLGYHRSRQLDRLLDQRLRLAEEFQRKSGRLAGSFWPVVWVARQTFLKWPPAFSRQSVFTSRERR